MKVENEVLIQPRIDLEQQAGTKDEQGGAENRKPPFLTLANFFKPDFSKKRREEQLLLRTASF